MNKIKSKDTVKILNGKYKGKVGEVIKVMPKSNKVIVKRVNILTKYEKASGNNKGGIIKVEGPINISKVMLIDPESGKPSRVKFIIDPKSGKKNRSAVKSGKNLAK